MAMDPNALEAIIRAAVMAATAGQTDSNQAIVEAAVNSATAQHQTSSQNMHRPTLPPFEPTDIKNWLRRVNAAFERLSITNPKIKLANLDEKLSSTGDACINAFMCGTPDQANYDALISYLREKHGRTQKQKAMYVINGTERQERRPSELWSVMKEKADDITLEDVMLEQLFRQLPSDVRMHLTDKGKPENKLQILPTPTST